MIGPVGVGAADDVDVDVAEVPEVDVEVLT